MKQVFNQCNLYIFLWLIYRLQGTLYPRGNIISVMALAIIFMISIYHYGQIMLWGKKTAVMKGLGLLLAMLSFYGVLLMITDGARTHGIVAHPLTFNYLKAYLASLLPIFTFYYYSKEGVLNVKMLQYWIPVFFLVAVAEYYTTRQEELETLLRGEEVTNNAGYLLVALLPCVYAFQKRWIQIIGITICVIFVMFSMKRGAILVMGIALLVYVYQQSRSLSMSRKIFFMVGIIAVGVILFNYLSTTLFESDYFGKRMELTMEGDTSGRDQIYSMYFNHYLDNFNAIQQLVGIGGDGTIKIGRNHAHNDWLEILIDQGLLGIIIFIYFWVQFFKTASNKLLPLYSRDIIFLVMIIIFVKTFFSMSIGNTPFYMLSILGLAISGRVDDGRVIKVKRKPNIISVPI